MRHQSREPRCATCGLKQGLCLCDEMPSIDTRTRVVIVMHGLEEVRSTNTGRLAARVLSRASIARFGPHAPALAPETLFTSSEQPAVLFPSSGSQPLASLRDAPHPVLVVLDGSWRQARRMRRRFADGRVPFVSVPEGAPSAYALRASPAPTALSTLEAIARALGVLEGPHVEATLLDVMSRFRDRTLWTRGLLARDAVHGGLPPDLLLHEAGRAPTRSP